MNKINLINSPSQNITNLNMKTNKKNKFYNSIFENNIILNQKTQKKQKEENGERLMIGCHSCTIKKNHGKRNLKTDLNQKLNNLKIIHLNTQSNTIKKSDKNILILNSSKNLLSSNIVMKTETNNHHFLDKVIQKINSNRDKNSLKNVIFGKNFKNLGEKKKKIAFLSNEKNNNFAKPYLVQHFNSHPNDGKQINGIKKLNIHLGGEKKYFYPIFNLKIIKNKDKEQRVFPNLIKYNDTKN